MLSAYEGKRILITGHTGFKGTWLSRILAKSGAQTFGISLKPESNSLFNLVPELNLTKSIILDINKYEKVNKIIKKIDPHLVFHLAAQPLVRRSYADPRGTFETNVMGTFNILESSLKCDSIRGVVAITTDKVYKNLEKLEGYVETDALGGKDPYSASKSASEMVITAWQEISNINKKIPIVSVRSGNVIGGGDYAEDRLIPDLIRGFQSNNKTVIRNPNSIRPWQHVLDPLSGYLAAGSKLLTGNRISKSYNFGPDNNSKLTVTEMANLACSYWPNNQGWMIDSKSTNLPESNLLWLDSSLARSELNWHNKLDANQAIKWTLDWEMNVKNSKAINLIDSQIKNYWEEL